jgi:HK97 family phage major capsid protein
MAILDRTIELSKLIQSRMSEVEGIKNTAVGEKRHLTEEERTRSASFMKDVIEWTGELELEKTEAGIRERLSKSANDGIRPHLDPHQDELQIKYPGLPDKNKRFAAGDTGLGENIVAIRNASTNHRIDSRLRAATGMGENVPSDGGFLVQQDYSAELINASFKASPIVAGVRKMSLNATSNGIKLPMVKEVSRALASLYGALAMYWIGEGDAITPGLVKFRQVAMEIKKIAALIPLTDELIQDTTALGSFVSGFFPGALNSNMERVIIRGSGVAQPLGILNSGALITVDKEDGALPDTIDGISIIKMFARMWASGILTSVWMISQSILPQLMNMSLPGFPNIPLWLPPTGLAASPYGTLVGRPVHAVEHCSKLGDLGDIIFADLNSYLLVDKGGPQNALSGDYYFNTDQTALRMIYRCDGQPLYVSAVTPADGSDTIGPFVTLEERA